MILFGYILISQNFIQNNIIILVSIYLNYFKLIFVKLTKY